MPAALGMPPLVLLPPSAEEGGTSAGAVNRQCATDRLQPAAQQEKRTPLSDVN